MISFKTDHEIKASGAHKYIITVETDIKRYYEAVQQVARDCVDDSTKVHKTESNTVTPYMESTEEPGASSKVYYVCSWCDCDLTPTNRGFFVCCPRCGKKIDYSNHYFLKEGLDAIR